MSASREEKIVQIKGGKIFKRGDIIAFIALLLACAFVFTLIFACAKEGKRADIYRDGELVHSMPLDVDDTYVFLAEDGGYNIIKVASGYVYVVDADCADKFCEDYGGKKNVGDTIICLPHGLKVVVEGGDN